MLSAFIRALGRAVITLLLAITFTFIILRVAGDPLHSLLPIETPPAVVELMRKQWGLDQPLYIDLPLNHREPWRQVGGLRQCGSRRDILVHPADPSAGNILTVLAWNGLVGAASNGA